MTSLPSTAGVNVTLRFQASGRFYYYTTPFGTTRTFGTKRLAISFARRHKWVVVDETN